MPFGFETTGSEVVEAFKDRVKGRTFLITGPSPDGIGAETAYCLETGNPRLVILAGRSRSKIQPVIDRLVEKQCPVDFLQLDLSSQQSVRRAVDDLKRNGTTVDVLINNAAVMFTPYQKTVDGIELQFGTNHFGPFLFTNLLLRAGLIKERVVSVNSSASVRKAAYALSPLDDLSYANGQKYDPVRAYTTSKIANLLCIRKLAVALKEQGISTFSLNPGSIISPLQRHMNDEVRKAAYAAAYENSYDFKPPVPKSLPQGCATQLRAALDPSLAAESGSYLDDCQVVEYQEHVEAYHAADRVWKISEDLVGERFDKFKPQA